MGKYQAYPEYNHSGNEFVGVLPARWERCTVGSVSNVIDPQPDHRAPEICSDGEGFPYIGIRDVNRDGTLNFDTARPVKESAVIKQEKSFSIEPNDIIFCKVGTLGLPRKIFPHGRCALSATLVLIKTKPNFISQFLLYALDSCVVTSQTDYLATGSTRAALGIQQIRRFQIPKPTVAEQTQIANFLDHETAKIDTLIEKQQQLIKLLKEKRQAVISHAVTKGLNPQAPMKNSGVKWLGEVPEHWVVKRLKHISPKVGVGLVINPSTYTKDEGTYFIFGGDVKEYGFDLTKTRKISQKDSDQLKASQLHHRDLVSIRVGYPGITAVVPEHLEGSNCASIIIIRRGEFDSDWLCAAMNIWVGRQQVDLASYGAAQKQFNVSDAIEFIFPVPPAEEQKKIASFVQSTLNKFTLLADQAQKQIELLKERRTALISAAITGKIDVRNWHAPDQEVQQQEAGL
ncbi:TPA: restriction endonuclease subunit S [Vibrio diabolicus]